MLCEKCGEREATVVYTEFVDGEKVTRHLCRACAISCTGLNMDQIAVITGSSLAGLLKDMMKHYQEQCEQPLDEGDMKKTNFICPACGTTYNEFLKFGTLGCKDCYRTFGLILDPSLDELQGSHQHKGEAPEGLSEFVDIPELKPYVEKKGDDLELQLKKAIESEDFETAARLRDEIRDKKVTCDA